jgi:hypothetical protein
MLPRLGRLLLPAVALALRKLMAVCELVTYTRVLHCRTLNMLEAIVVPIHLQIIG